MNLLAKKEPPMRPRPVPEPVDIEADIAEIAKVARRGAGLGNSRDMERAKELLSSGLTAAYKDGAEALEQAIDQANAEREKLKNAVAKMDAEMDHIKRQAAEHILDLKSRCSEITAAVEARMVHLEQMLRWLEDQRTALKHPPQPAPTALLEPPAEHQRDD